MAFGKGYGSGGFGSAKPRFDSLQNASQQKPSTAPIPPASYAESPEISKLSEEEVSAFRAKHEMYVLGRQAPRPIKSFSQVDFGSQLIHKRLLASGFQEPTPIQAQGWPVALSGKNLVGIAQTGSGKTLSYGLPALSHIKRVSSIRVSERNPIVLVLAPTRELACQIQEVVRPYGNLMRQRTVCVYGGVPKGSQGRLLRDGCDIVIATPGRLQDFVDAGEVSLSEISFLVLDEADRMLDMGFEPQIRKLLESIRPDLQVLLWSATWPKGVQRLAHDLLGRDFIQINIGREDTHTLTANKKIHQRILFDKEDKEGTLVKLLLSILENGPDAWIKEEKESSNPDSLNPQSLPKTIVFCNKKRICDDLANKAYQDGWHCDSLHGDKTQQQRDAVLVAFKSGKTPLLFATDVAARGLDVKDVRVVINFDMPADVEDYVHRIGRTARGSDERFGCAYAFFSTSEDKGLVKDLVGLLQNAQQPVPEQLKALLPRSRPNTYSRYNGGFGSRGGFRGRRGGRGGSYRPY